MALVTNGYASLAGLQRETGNSDEELEDWFEECILAASRWIDEHCKKDFLSHDYSGTAYTVKESEMHGDSIFFAWPIITLTEVKTGDLVIDSTLYTAYAGQTRLQLKDGSAWLSKPKNRNGHNLSYGMQWEIARVGFSLPITVKGTFGYTEPPASITRACVLIAAAWSQEKRREKLSMDGSRQSIMDDRIPDDAIMLLKRYKKLIN